MKNIIKNYIFYYIISMTYLQRWRYRLQMDLSGKGDYKANIRTYSDHRRNCRTFPVIPCCWPSWLEIVDGPRRISRNWWAEICCAFSRKWKIMRRLSRTSFQRRSGFLRNSSRTAPIADIMTRKRRPSLARLRLFSTYDVVTLQFYESFSL